MHKNCRALTLAEALSLIAVMLLVLAVLIPNLIRARRQRPQYAGSTGRAVMQYTTTTSYWPLESEASLLPTQP